ncbi:MAG: hypothetical protein HYS25_05985 [Ignavibacteriales bacterium]|nr:hypothetical protein [Ignavibacteriales bacterium]
MNYFIGIDGGGTKTRSILADDNLRILQTIEGGAANPLTAGFGKSARTMLGLIKKISRKKKIAFITAGIAGTGRELHKKKLKQEIIKQAAEQKIVLNNFEIISDAHAAVEGAFSGKPGIILIAGTGSILFGKDSEGNFIRIGGYGKLIGDEGSGYSIGKKGLSTAAKMIDKRITNSILPGLINKKFNIGSRDELITKIYSDNFDIASAAPLVIDAARSGDKHSLKILEEECSALTDHLKAAIKLLKANKINLCLSGGLLSNKNFYSTMLTNKIKDDFKNVRIKKAEHPPEFGAVLLAKKYYESNPANKYDR